MKKIYCPLCGAKLEPIQRGGRERGLCPRCRILYYDNPLPATAAVVMDQEGRLLLVKRAKEPAAGRWSLPGGFIEGEESPVEGVKRELQEETGLRGEVKGLIGVFHDQSPLYGPLVIIGYGLELVGGELRPGDDAEEAAFFSPEDMPEIAFKSHKELAEEARRRWG